MATPPPPAPGAEVDTFTITNTEVDANNDVFIQVDQFADKNNANDIAIVNTATDPIDYLRVEKFGDNDGQEDVLRIDLSEFSGDFTLDIRNTGNTVQDQLYLEGVHEFTDNGDGTFTATYYGSDSNLYTVTILPEEAAVTPYYALDGIVTGDDGAETMGDGFVDTQGDEIGSGDGDPNDLIHANGGSDTIYGGDGDDTIIGDYTDLVGRLAPSMPDYTYTGAPAGPAAGAEVDTFAINDANIDNNGKVTVQVDTFANKDNANDVTIVHGGTEDITEIVVEKFGDGDGQADVIRFDLSTYDDDFLVVIANEDTFDTVIFEGVHTVTDNGDGTWSLTYFGTDAALHSVTVDPDTAHVEFYVAESSPYFYDDLIDGGDGNDAIDGGYGDDDIIGGLGNDTIIGNIGRDTLDGGDGADVIYGDWDQKLTAEIAPPPAPSAEVDTFSIGDPEINAGAVTITVDQFADPNNENDILVTDDAATESIATISLVKMGNGDGQADVFRFDLSSFDDNFAITVASEGTEDTFVFEDVAEANDNGDGTWTITYYGEDNQLHTVDVTPGAAAIEIYYAPPPESLLAPQTDDTITGGAGDDIIDGGYGNDSIDAGADNDSVDGGYGDDTIIGGTGNDTLYGGDALADVPLERVAFQWSNVPDPDDGGQIDNNDAMVDGSQTVNGVTVDYTFTTANVTYQTEAIYTGGIDPGAGTVNPNSALSLDDAVTIDLDFSQLLTNLEFNIADLEVGAEVVTIYAFDDLGNPIPIDVTEGANIVGSDTDAVAGNDQFVGTVDPEGDTAPTGAISVSVPGPVSSLQIVMTAPISGSAVMSDIWFDDPATGIAGGGDDSLDGGDGDDIFVAGLGTDTIAGGTGTDTYDADTSTDLSGETITVTIDANGDGTVVKSVDGTTDTFTSLEEFVAAEAGAEADSISFADLVDSSTVSGFSDGAVGVFTPQYGTSGPIAFGGASEPTITQILAGTYVHPTAGEINPAGDYVISGGEEDGATVGGATFSNFENIEFGVVCFVRGTHILTPTGEVPVEKLKVGHRVMTADHGAQQIRWIGSSRVPRAPNLQPIRIARGALGSGLPIRTLYVSPQHRLLVRSRVVERMTGSREVLVAAKKLVGLRGIHPDTRTGYVRYFHILCDAHEVVFANGAPAETLLPGPNARTAMGQEAWSEITSIFPAISETSDRCVPARAVVQGARLKHLTRRHRRNKVPLIEHDGASGTFAGVEKKRPRLQPRRPFLP